MHSSPLTSTPPAPPPTVQTQYSPESRDLEMDTTIDSPPLPFQDEPLNSLWDWSDFLDLTFDDPLTVPFDSEQASDIPPLVGEPPQITPTGAVSPEKSGRIRKRDARLTCSNFLAGRVPCACPEIDEKLDEDEGGPGKKRPKTSRVSAKKARCQVPDCKADISELKGYHRRHRVCLRCANASAVVLDGQSKRYCQQCGRFHFLPDFDEGKRSCRRKLERHNNRRRRKPTDSKGSIDKEPEQILSGEDVGCDVETGKDITCLSSQISGRESLLESEGHISNLSSAHDSQNIQCDSVISFAASGETQIDCEKDNSKSTHSPSYCDNKSAFSSVCPTGRISFKLYDWNPADFPRRLRHQIFQWLASMPVELEGYIRPGCTILTMFIAMPKFMWIKLFEDPHAFVHDFVVAPGSMLSGRGKLFVYINNMIFHVMKDGTSVMKMKVVEHAPTLHYVHPICFEAGKPIEFVACGSNLLQPKFRLLVSFDGKYLAHDLCAPLLCGETERETASGFDHQFFKIRISHTEPDLFGPAFIEVENESGLSNFIPILIGDKEVCSEVKTMQQRFDTSLGSKGSQFSVTSFPCEVSVLGLTEFSELISNMAWLLKEPVLESMQHTLTSFQIQRFNFLLSFLIKNESIAILERALHFMEVIKGKSVATGIPNADMQLFQRNLNHARDILHDKKGKRNLVPCKDCFYPSSQNNVPTVLPDANQDVEVTEECRLGGVAGVNSPDGSGTVPLLNGDVVMRVNVIKEQPRMSYRRLYNNKVLPFRPLVLMILAAAVCCGVCAVFLHPEKVGKLAITIRRCLLDLS